VDAALDREAGVHPAERPGEPHLFRAALRRRNYGLPGLLRGARIEDAAFAEGHGPHPATKDTATAFVGFPEEDPLLNDR
jgi:hypothetical protein